jgi:hypothetical protein
VGEGGGELIDDPVAQHIGHVQDVGVDYVVRRDIRGPVAAEARDRLSERGVEVGLPACAASRCGPTRDESARVSEGAVARRPTEAKRRSS